MKDYRHFSVNDFVLDEYFQTWVLTPDENINGFWASWIQENPEKTAEVDEARSILHTLRLSNYSLSSAAIATIWKKIQQGEIVLAESRKKTFGITPWYWAAAAIILMGIGLTFLTNSEPHRLEYQTAFGENQTIYLPDSSVVILNANSRLSFDNQWKDQPVREVWLEGEAYFSVTHKDNHQPFKVLTNGGVAVEVLGTTFNVYHRSVDTKVMLNTGKIRLSLPLDKKENKTILMKPGELVEYKKNNYSKRNVNPTVYAAWTEKKIILDQTSLQEMIRMAKDNYGVVIEVAPKELLTQTVSGSMPVADADSFVFQMAKAFQLKAIKEEDKFLIIE